jgi:hypothetical protein
MKNTSDPRETGSGNAKSSATPMLRRMFLGSCFGAFGGYLAFPSRLKEAFHTRRCETLFSAAGAAQVDSRVELDSSDPRLNEGFRWAKNQALAYVFTGDPVGPWYEAALPGRQAFCMRDTAHQSTGAQILGLAAFNENMLGKFAQNISASKDWCSYWEMNKDNIPAPVDYVNNRDFWYNLPANFDVLDACYRQFLWTGNKAYLDPAFLNFYTHTVTDYVKRWDIQGDGFLQHLPEYGHRGIASYEERHIGQTRVGADLVAAQFAAYLDYAQIQSWGGDHASAEEFSAKASHLKSLYNKDWWSDSSGSFFAAIGNDGQFIANLGPGLGSNVLFPLYCSLIDAGQKTEVALDEISARFPVDDEAVGGVEEGSYLPEILYRYGRADVAYRALQGLMAPTLKRREYPEVSFAAVGACATGLMGLSANSVRNTVDTFPQLSAIEWVELKHVPIFANQASVRHVGNRKTTFTNESGTSLHWRASFPGRFEKLTVDGKQTTANSGTRLGGATETWILVTVDHGAKHTVEAVEKV